MHKQQKRIEGYIPPVLLLKDTSHNVSHILAYVIRILLPVLLGIGSFWNILVIVYFIRINGKKLKKMSSYHFLVINLAIADLITTVASAIYYHYAVQTSWELGEFGCVFMMSFVGYVCPLASTWILVLISYARYRSIIDTLSNPNQQNKIWTGMPLHLGFIFSFKRVCVY